MPQWFAQSAVFILPSASSLPQAAPRSEKSWVWRLGPAMPRRLAPFVPPRTTFAETPVRTHGCFSLRLACINHMNCGGQGGHGALCYSILMSPAIARPVAGRAFTGSAQKRLDQAGCAAGLCLRRSGAFQGTAGWAHLSSGLTHVAAVRTVCVCFFTLTC